MAKGIPIWWWDIRHCAEMNLVIKLTKNELQLLHFSVSLFSWLVSLKLESPCLNSELCTWTWQKITQWAERWDIFSFSRKSLGTGILVKSKSVPIYRISHRRTAWTNVLKIYTNLLQEIISKGMKSFAI